MHQLFDVAWERLDVAAIKRFLADAGDEGLLWEAKGTKAPHRDSVLKAVCGFANALGGYLILGAERRAETWVLSGLEFVNEEPATWVSSLIAPAGLSPLPTFDARSFDVGEGRRAVVVRVEPVPAPPCITTSGVAFQRVSGQTLPITDQRVLADLLEKGEAAHRATGEAALRGAQRLLREPEAFGPTSSLFALSVCATGGPSDKAAALFDQARAMQFHQLVSQRLQPDSGLGYGTSSATQQDCLRAWTTSHELGAVSTAAAFWDGTVGVVLCAKDADYNVAQLTADVGRFWPAVAEAVALFGGSGEAHLAIVFNTAHSWLTNVRLNERPRTDVRRWTVARRPSAEEVANVTREIERGFGRKRWES